MNRKSVLKLLAPYLAVIVFWCVLRNAWLSILAYHAQILFWSRRDLERVGRGWDTRLFLLFALPCVLAGPAVYSLAPVMCTRMPISQWFRAFGLTGVGLTLMIPYFGVVHPLLEQAHWRGIRQHGWAAHVAFGGYHVMVLMSLLPMTWTLFCFGVLWAASAAWHHVQCRTRSGLLVPCCAQVIADLGIVLAAWLRAGH